MVSHFLIGGGWDPAFSVAIYGGFLAEAASAATTHGAGEPIIATVVLDEGDGLEQFERWRSVLESVTPCRPLPVLVPLGGQLDVAELGEADGLLVCGGLTPGYAEAIAPAAAAIRVWLAAADRPYAGFSAGSAIAPSTALVGGWLDGEVPVCSDDAAEDLEQITLRSGLGFVPYAVDVHCAQWGTLPRLISAVLSSPGMSGIGIDENTVLTIGSDVAVVGGRGQVWRVAQQDGSAVVTPYRAGQQVPLAGPLSSAGQRIGAAAPE